MKPTMIALVCLVPVASGWGDDWPGFRGHNGTGVSNSEGVPTTWGPTQNLKWSLELPGKGYSSPIVIGDSVYVTCYSGESNLAELQRHLVCVHRDTGKVVWSKSFKSKAAEKNIPRFAGTPGFASHTPVSDGEKIYAFFGNSGLHAFDMDGNLVWRKELGTEENAMFGSAASPVLYKDRVIVLAASESESVRAFNKETGEEVWKTDAQSLNRSYTTPVIGQSKDGRDELLVPVVGEVWSLNPDSGKLNWYCNARTDTALCPVVVVKDGIAFCVGGRGGGRTAIRLGGKGDVTESHTVWSSAGGSYVPSPVIRGDHMYWVNDSGIATCVDLATGKEAGKRRLGGKFYASVTLIGDKLYAVSRYTGTHVLAATPELTEIAHNKLEDDSDHSASPAVSNGQLFIRSDKGLYCIAAE